MKIVVKGFKCHLELELSFTDNNMTLIKGPSGIGKSSILQAIAWALYGNMRNIYHNAKVTKELAVTLEIGDLVIFRKKNPELLTVSQSEHLYEDAVAQSVIDNLWGSREVWRACCMIEQQSRCTLLSGSAAERLDLLNSLSFTGESPQIYLKAISNQLKEVTQTFTERQASLNTEIELYSQQLINKPVTLTSSKGTVSQYQEQLSNLIEQSEKLYLEVTKSQQDVGRLQYLEKEVKQLEERLSGKEIFTPNPPRTKDVVTIPPHLYQSIPRPDTVSFNFSNYAREKQQLIGKIENAERAAKKCQEELAKLRPELERQQEEIVKIPGAQDLVNETITGETIWKTEQLERDRTRYDEICRQLKVEYSDSLQNEIQDLAGQVDHLGKLQGQVDTYKRLLEVRKQIESSTVTPVDDIEELIQKQEALISELKRGLEVLTCPECQTALRYQNKSLLAAEVPGATPEQVIAAEKRYQELQKLNIQLKRLDALHSNASLLQQQLTATEVELNKFLSSNDLIEMKKRLERLRSIKYFPQPKTSSNTLKQIQTFQKCYFRIVELEEQLQKIPDVTPEKETLKNMEAEHDLAQHSQEIFNEYQKSESRRLSELRKLEEEKKRQERDNEAEEKRYRDQRALAERQADEIQQLEQQINVKRVEISEIVIDETVAQRYEKIKLDIKAVERQIRETQYGDEMVKRGEQLEQKREDLMKLYADLETLSRLKHKASEAECQQLEDTVANVNSVVQQVLPIFFNEPIELRFSLYKKLKSKKDQIKPGLNLEISYRGCTYDGVNQLSGGEGDRISLAVLLGLNSVSNSPILLLDECVASLDSELKESCITAIKAIPNKTVICVDHDDTLEGFYDAVVAL